MITPFLYAYIWESRLTERSFFFLYTSVHYILFYFFQPQGLSTLSMLTGRRM